MKLISLVYLILFFACIPKSTLEKDYFPLIDSSNKVHSYDSLISIDINESIVKYCATHYEWETILLRYTTRLDDPIGIHFNSTEYMVRQK